MSAFHDAVFDCKTHNSLSKGEGVQQVHCGYKDVFLIPEGDNAVDNADYQEEQEEAWSFVQEKDGDTSTTTNPEDVCHMWNKQDDESADDEDWDLISNAGSVWTTGTDCCTDRQNKSFRDAVLEYRPQQRMNTKQNLPLFRSAKRITQKSQQNGLNEKMADSEAYGGEYNFGASVREDYKHGRGGKHNTRWTKRDTRRNANRDGKKKGYR